MKGVLDGLGIPPRGERNGLRLTVLVACLVVGAVFIRASLPKIHDPNAFALAVFHYQACPDRWINLVALFLPWLELVCGVAVLVLPRFRVAAGIWIAAMLVLFAGLQISTIVRGIDISCGCFSVGEEAGRIGWLNVARNAGLLVATLWIVVWGTMHRADCAR